MSDALTFVPETLARASRTGKDEARQTEAPIDPARDDTSAKLDPIRTWIFVLPPHHDDHETKRFQRRTQAAEA